MDKSISDLMERNLTTVAIDDTVDRVEAIMDSHKLTCVPVIDSKKNCFGIISSTDLIHFKMTHENPKIVHAWEVFTHKVIEASSDMSVKEAT